VEYYRQPNGKIQADFALRAGRLLSQYATLSASLQESERYEATLMVCILHSILTNCLELIGELKKHHWDSPIKDVPGLFGICRSFVVRNAFPGEVTYAKFIEHIRNALCHPTIAEKKPKLPSTGYTTIPGSGLISKFSFVHSPWVHSGRMDFRANHKSKDKVEKFAKTSRRGTHLNSPSDYIMIADVIRFTMVKRKRFIIQFLKQRCLSPTCTAWLSN